MSYIAAELRRAVIARAGNRCEYCGLSQQGQAATFHIDHVVPLALDGPTSLDNLALACVACSLYKGARQEATDPQSGEEVSLFNPRKQHSLACGSASIISRYRPTTFRPADASGAKDQRAISHIPPRQLE